MTVDDLLYLIGKMTVERELLQQRNRDLEQRIEELERQLNVATPESIVPPNSG